VLEGKFYLSDTIEQAITTQFVGGRTLETRSPVDQLSDRELEILDLLGKGLGTRHIADTLHVSIKTVQAHCGRMKEKLRLNSASELVREAVRHYQSQNPDD
jgi:DNA-binding CsgD family transcriptional regulator